MSDPNDMAETLSLLAHDLKNPLAAVLTNLGFVRGFVDALDPSVPPDEAELSDVREAMLDAKLACEALQRFVGNLEVISRDLGGGRASFPPEQLPLDVLALADEAAARHQLAAKSRRLELVVESNGPCWARGDRDSILRAADNLIANAVQYAPAGTRVTVEVAAGDQEVTLTVVDTGIAIPERMREDAVTREGQSRAKGTAEARYGRGLALYAAATSARIGGGRLVVGTRDAKSAIGIALLKFSE
jgi:signal transduction histidine kinase